MTKNHQVNQIIAFLTEKIERLKKDLSNYESPIMQDMSKNSSSLQYDYIRVKTELQSHEDILLVIQKFTDEPEANKD